MRLRRGALAVPTWTVRYDGERWVGTGPKGETFRSSTMQQAIDNAKVRAALPKHRVDVRWFDREGNQQGYIKDCLGTYGGPTGWMPDISRIRGGEGSDA